MVMTVYETDIQQMFVLIQWCIFSAIGKVTTAHEVIK